MNCLTATRVSLNARNFTIVELKSRQFRGQRNCRPFYFLCRGQLMRTRLINFDSRRPLGQILIK
jgi:hypothetical protein